MPDPATDQLVRNSRNVGRWMAWNRDQTRLLATGNSYEEAKLAAAATGERSVTIAKLAAIGPRRRPRWAPVMAVFIAIAPSLSLSGSNGTESIGVAETPVSVTSSEEDASDRVP